MFPLPTSCNNQSVIMGVSGKQYLNIVIFFSKTKAENVFWHFRVRSVKYGYFRIHLFKNNYDICMIVGKAFFDECLPYYK